MADLWQSLGMERRPILLYGTGNGADKILDVCAARKIPVSGVFASDGFVRDRTFRGMPVRAYDDILAQFGEDIVILLCFGTTRDDVIARIRALDARHTLRIPEVPLCGGALFDSECYSLHLQKINEVQRTLADKASQTLFDNMIAFRLTGEPRYLANAEPMEEHLRLLRRPVRTALDCGAYTGDSARRMAEVLQPETVIAAEPDPRSFAKLAAYAAAEPRCRIVPVHAAVGAENGATEFVSSGSRASGAGANTGHRAGRRVKTQTVPVRTVDDILAGAPADFLKFDVEGAEADALAGAAETIRKFHPALAVSLYHRTEDLWELPLALRPLYPNAAFYLRRIPCIPAWDLMLYVVN